MASVIGIYNMALSHLGVGKEVADVEEDSEEAAALNRFYEQARDEMLRAFPWPFATKIAALALVEEDPNDEWSFSYSVPSDCLALRRILSGSRNDSRQDRVPYREAYGTAGAVIFTDMEDAELEYTVRVSDAGRFAPDFAQALACLLASYVAPRLTAGDPNGLGKRALQLYQYYVSRAQAQALNEEQAEEEPQSEFVRGRE